MIRCIITVLFVFILQTANAQNFKTQAISPDIYTIQCKLNGVWNLNPIMQLNSNDFININFDRISEDSFNRLRYKITHCDAIWNKSSGLSEIDYLDGFNDNPIEDFQSSVNTTVEYTHFNLNIPNEEVNIKLSGNYVVEIYEEEQPETILLTTCFSVVEPLINVGVSITSNTDIDTNKEHQQVSCIINHPNLNIRDPFTELKIFIKQNNRSDTERLLGKPTYISNNKLTYEHTRDLIFEAGNEYRRFETSSYRYNGMNVEHIEYNRPYYTMYIVPGQIRANASYRYDQDQNGRFVVRSNDTNSIETEADYFYTTFTLISEKELNEPIYINGDFTENTFTDKYKMKYDHQQKTYSLTLLLKQGLYNYQYLTKGSGNRYTTALVEGNYFETENEYEALVYYSPNGQRYDSLIGVQNIQSRKK